MAEIKRTEAGTPSSSFSRVMFFSEKVTGCVYHVIKPEYDDEDDELLIPKPSFSAPVRVGPLDFKIKAVLRTWTETDSACSCSESDDEAHCERRKDALVWSLIYDNVSPGFPWSGEVEVKFEVLEKGTDCPTDWTDSADCKKVDVSSDQKRRRRLRARDFWWSRLWDYEDDYGDHPRFANFLDDDHCLHVRAFLTVKVGLKSGPGLDGGTWRIPRILLEKFTSASPHTTAFPDITLVSRDGKEFPANRVILAGRSDVFTTMFTRTEMKEGVEGKVKIEDIGGKALDLMLKFLYSGNIREEMEKFEEYELDDFLELVHAGHKYNITVLMKLGGVALLMRCRKENASELHSALEIYGDGVRECRSALEEFMSKHSEPESTTVENDDSME